MGMKSHLTNIIKHLRCLQILHLDFFGSVRFNSDYVGELQDEIIENISKDVSDLKIRMIKLCFGSYGFHDPVDPIRRRLKKLSFIPVVSIR